MILSAVGVGGVEVEEWEVNGHFFCRSSAEYVHLFMDVEHECLPCPSAHFHDSGRIVSLNEEGHGPTCPKGVGADKVWFVASFGCTCGCDGGPDCADNVGIGYM